MREARGGPALQPLSNGLQFDGANRSILRTLSEMKLSGEDHLHGLLHPYHGKNENLFALGTRFVVRITVERGVKLRRVWEKENRLEREQLIYDVGISIKSSN